MTQPASAPIILRPGATSWEPTPIRLEARTSTAGCGPSSASSRRIRPSSGASSLRIRAYAGCAPSCRLRRRPTGAAARRPARAAIRASARPSGRADPQRRHQLTDAIVEVGDPRASRARSRAGLFETSSTSCARRRGRVAARAACPRPGVEVSNAHTAAGARRRRRPGQARQRIGHGLGRAAVVRRLVDHPKIARWISPAPKPSTAPCSSSSHSSSLGRGPQHLGRSPWAPLRASARRSAYAWPRSACG